MNNARNVIEILSIPLGILTLSARSSASGPHSDHCLRTMTGGMVRQKDFSSKNRKLVKQTNYHTANPTNPSQTIRPTCVCGLNQRCGRGTSTSRNQTLSVKYSCEYTGAVHKGPQKRLTFTGTRRAENAFGTLRNNGHRQNRAWSP